MRAALALSMSTEGVVLYSASGGGWTRLGRANFAERNLATQMTALRRVAEAYSSDPDLPTLLVVPDNLVLWRGFAAAPAGRDAASINGWLRAEMAGLTPYDPADLRIDWRRDGAGVQVAVIAKETMQEAENFASGHGFTPCGVAAVPPGAGFPGTAHFGLTGVAAAPDGRAGVAAPDDAAAMRLPRPEDIGGAAMRAGQPQDVAEAPRSRRSASPAAAAAWLKQISRRQFALPAQVSQVPLFIWLSAALIMALAVAALLLPDRATVNGAMGQLLGTRSVGQAELAVPSGDVIEADPDLSADPSSEILAMDGGSSEAPASAGIPQPVPVLDLVPAAPDDSVQPALDIVRPVDALALADAEVAVAPARPAAPSLPAPRAARVAVDARGFVLPTAKGVRTADGYLVVAGQPPLQPGTRPEIPLAVPEVTRLASAGDPLGRVHPLPRPGGLQKNYELVVYGGRTRDEVERMRPSPRNAARAAEFTARFAPLRPQVEIATAATARPAARPAGLARKSSVSAARAAQQASAAASTAAFMAKPPAPVIAVATPVTPPKKEVIRKETRAVKQRNDPALDDNEPDIIPSLTPDSRPVNAPINVAARATEKNELDLSEVNLLGTFGRPGSMRAMVRTPNGRISTVKTGDRLDGGQVIAISHNELRYLRRGRNISLTMPEG